MFVEFLPLVIGLVLFICGHWVGSSRPVRHALTERLGENGFLGAYSAAMGVFMAAMIFGYAIAPTITVWESALWTRWIPFVLMPFALFLITAAFTQPNATFVGRTADSPGGAASEDPAAGVMAITRHPMLWGTVLFALAHIPPNGDLASLLLFVGIAMLSIVGAFHIDYRRTMASRESGTEEAWDRLVSLTSNVPFLGLIQRKTHLSAKEIGPWPPLIGVAAFLIALLIHERVLGVSPFPIW